jgi:hypothetical protein
MRKILLIVIIVALCSLHAWSQALQVRVKGRITDKDSQQALADASVTLLHAKDSSRAAIAFTDKKGAFLLEGLRAGSYQLYITYLGYQSIFQSVEIGPADTMVNIGAISMQGTGVHLKAIEIVQVRAPMVVKRDTLEFNAEHYKTRENAVMEELLKKLPGVQIEKDGTIKVNGETVKKILVNGKPFFGDDPKLATRNLPADMIDKIQLLDRKSDQDQLLGIENGKREQAINITIKKDRKGRFLGRFSGGYGTDGKFAAGGNLNRFSDGEQLSLLAGGNNVNNPGFLEGSGLGIVNGGNGITRNWNGGINYNRDIAGKLKITGSYNISDNRVENERISARQNLLPDTTYYYNQDAYSVNKNTDQAAYIQMEYKPDTMHQLAVSASYYKSRANNLQENVYESLDGKKQLVNSGNTNNLSISNTSSFYSYLSFGKKFKKAGRRLGVAASMNYIVPKQENFNRSNNFFVEPGGDTHTDTINQWNDIGRRQRNLQLTFVYTEPVFRDHFLDLTYVYTTDHTSSEKLTYDYDPARKVYDRLNDSLSNAFETVYAYHTPGISLHTQGKKYGYSIGIYTQISELDSRNISLHSQIKQRAVNFYPIASFNYAFSNNKRFRANYWSSVQQPSVEQLQPVPDNSNPLYIQLGNPGLKMAFNQALGLRYSFSDVNTARSFIAYMNIQLMNNKIVNANWFDSLGRQVSQPQNVNGAYSINTSMVNSFPIKHLRAAINANTAFGFNRDINFINGVQGTVRNFNFTQGLGFNYAHNDLFDISLNASVGYNGVRYAVQKNNNTNFFNYAFSFNGNLNLPLGLMIGGNLDYMLNAGRAEGYNLNATMLNGYIAKKLFHQSRGLIKLQAFDLLNRNLSISRNVGDNYIEDVQSTVLQRFFMLSFSYYLKPASAEK